MAAPLQRFQLNRYLKNMADRLNTPGLSSAEQDRIRRGVDQGFTNVIYHSTPDDFEDIDLNYTDVGFHAGTPVQARNRALDKAIQAGLQSHRNQGIYIPGTHVLPLAYRPGKSITARDVGEWKDAYSAALGLRSVPELGDMKDWLDESLDYLEHASTAYGGTNQPDWWTSMENLSSLSDIRNQLLDRGIRQIEYANDVESQPGLMVPEYEDRLRSMTDEAHRLYKAGLERRPSSVPPELGASPEAIEAFLKQRSPDPLDYLSPEERALYDKYYGDIKRIENSPAAYDPVTSRIFLDPADLRSIYAPFDPSKAGEVGLWKAEGGPVEMGGGGLASAVQAAKKAVGDSLDMPQVEVEAGRERVLDLYHGGNLAGRIQEKGGLFDGIFLGDRSAASSHGKNLYKFSIPEKKIAEVGDFMGYSDLPWEDQVAAIIRVNPSLEPSSDDFDLWYKAVVDDKSHEIDADDMERIFGRGDAGENSWEAQRQRGQLAKHLGYDAVAMSDEHGTSYLLTRDYPYEQAADAAIDNEIALKSSSQVTKKEGGPVFDPNKISAMAEELVNPYYEFEPVDHEADDVQYMAGGGQARQWLKDVVEKEVGRFKQRTPAETDPEKAMQDLQEAMAQEDVQALPEGTKAALQRALEDLQRKTALNSWLGRTATKYIKRDYGTESDPMRTLGTRHVEGDWPPAPGLHFLNLPTDFGGVRTEPAARFIDEKDTFYPIPFRRDMLERNPWMSTLPPDELIYTGFDAGPIGLSHLVDELKNAVNPDSGLPRNLQIRPESLQRMSFPQASELVGRINQWRAAQQAEANAAIANNAATKLFKEYPEGYRWVELTRPEITAESLPPGYEWRERTNNQGGTYWSIVDMNDRGFPIAEHVNKDIALRLAKSQMADERLAQALKYEGDTMQHCVGGYCEPVLSGATRIFSLRDPKGMPHVTIEAQPRFHPEHTDFGEYWYALGEKLKAQGQIPDRNAWFDQYLEDTDAFARKAAEVLGDSQDIIQIKGKQNAAPAEQYVPYVQDFIRSQNWREIQELQNARMIDARRMREGANAPQRYMTQQEYDDYLLSLLRQEQGNGMKEGGEVKDEKTAMDELEEAWNALRAGFMTQYTPDEQGMPGLALSTATLPAIPGMLTGLAGAGVAMIDPEMGLGIMKAGDYFTPEYAEEYDARYAALMDDLLERYGMGSVGDLDAGDRFALAAGEMLGQVPAPGAWLKRLSKFTNKIPRPVRLGGEYFMPTVDPKLANYAAGTAVGGSLYQLEGPDEPEISPTAAEELMTYRPPAFPGMADGGPVFDADRINAMAMELMEPQKLAGGGLARAAKGAAKAGKVSDVEAGRIARAVEDETRSRGPINEAAAFEASMRPLTAAERAEAGRRAAAWIKTQEQIKASEALGRLMEQGFRRTTTTQADRTRVGGGNIGGAAFPAIGVVNPSYAGKAWGVMDQGTASRLTNLTTPDTAWTTMLGSATQLKTNPIVFDKLKRGFLSAMKEGKLTSELAEKINQNLSLTFGEGVDIRDPKIWSEADTFEKRAALADVMMGQGVAPSKGGVALGGEKSGRGVIFRPSEILKQETERALLHPEHGGDVPTFAIGPRMFSLDTEVDYRPDLHPGFPTLIQGRDLGVNVMPTPAEVYLPDWHREFKAANPERKGPGYYDLALGMKGRGLPSQALTDEYIRHLLREGFAKGGLAAYKDMIGA